MRISHRKRFKPTGPFFHYNTGIRAEELRVIDEDGQHLGVLKFQEALQKAREKGLDLVEINPKANPPIARMTDYNQFKYQQEKERRRIKAHQKIIEIKGIRLSLRIGQHDLDIRAEQAKKFLEDGDKVRVEIILRGRERQHLNVADQIIKNFISSLNDVRIEQPLQHQGGVVSMLVAKN